MWNFSNFRNKRRRKKSLCSNENCRQSEKKANNKKNSGGQVGRVLVYTFMRIDSMTMTLNLYRGSSDRLILGRFFFLLKIIQSIQKNTDDVMIAGKSIPMRNRNRNRNPKHRTLPVYAHTVFGRKKVKFFQIYVWCILKFDTYN